MKIENINWGIASRVGKTIYLNKRLKYYPKLKKALTDHEKAHTDGMAMRDIFLDVDIKELKGLKREYYKFLFSTPTAWAEFLPIKKYGGEWLLNLPVLLMWLFFIAIIWFVIILT